MPGPPRTDTVPARHPERGVSLLEVLICLALAVLAVTSGWSALNALRDERIGREAARAVASTLRGLALEARTRGRSLAVEFDVDRARWRVLIDGNGNGVVGSEIAAGIDPVLTDWSPVLREPRARLAVTRDLPASGGDPALPAGTPPVRLGAVPRLTFTPRGTSGSGAIYVAGPGDRAYLVRILGNTQRVRLHCLNPAGVWEAC
jgi:hypothetical protein